nr:Methyltransferase [Kibdelosporangium sp. MJ126-NF4]
MTDVASFGRLHAAWYDRWFQAKDYRAEVEQLSEVVEAHMGTVGSVLDIGCGTGRHLELLSDAGYVVTGVDRSTAMLDLAVARLGSRAHLVESDVGSLDLGREFDVVTLLSWVIGYNITDDDLFATLAVVRRHLRPGGLLVFDVLDAAALLRSHVRGGCNVIEDGTSQFVRASTGRILPDDQIYEITIRMWMFFGTRMVAAGEQEVHPIRYFTPSEVELVLESAGFTLLGAAPLAGLQSGPAREWSRLYWARKS